MEHGLCRRGGLCPVRHHPDGHPGTTQAAAFIWPLIILTDQEMYTLPVALANLVGEHVQDTELIIAGAALTVLPVMVLFLALQKYYIAGLLLGSIKE